MRLFSSGTPGKSYVAVVLRLRRIPGVPDPLRLSTHYCDETGRSLLYRRGRRKKIPTYAGLEYTQDPHSGEMGRMAWIEVRQEKTRVRT
jgi:hypothetical protein